MGIGIFEAAKGQWSHAGVMLGLFFVLIVYDCFEANGVFPWSDYDIYNGDAATARLDDFTEDMTYIY